MNHLRLAVIGAGHLGRIHARLLASIADAQLVSIADPSSAVRHELAPLCGEPPVSDFSQLLGRIDAAIVGTPTQAHFDVARQLLEAGVHVFVEKPMCAVVEQAAQLVQLARKQGCVLQVGHIERFNPAFDAVWATVRNPKYIDASRTSGYTFRSTDVGVVLDLMIHDLDIVLALAGSEVCDIRALGVSVLGSHEDIAQARLEFANGCVANLAASRCSLISQRKMSIYCPHVFANVDFAERRADVVWASDQLLARELDTEQLSADDRQYYRDHLFQSLLKHESVQVEDSNPLLDELQDFVTSIRSHSAPQVSGEDGQRALSVAERILEAIDRSTPLEWARN